MVQEPMFQEGVLLKLNNYWGERCKNEISVEYGTIDSLYDFAGISESDIEIIEEDNIKFRVPNLKQFLSIYQASSKDSYRDANNNNKDFAKIDWFSKHL